MLLALLHGKSECDFGDSWEHVGEAENVHAPDRLANGFVQCLDGARACPPDDCGGAGGYEELLAALGDLNHKEHGSMLKWPRMTDDQLARVLMERDSYRESRF